MPLFCLIGIPLLACLHFDACKGEGRTTGSSGGFGSGCFADSTIIWTKNETQSDAYAKEVMVKDLKEGSLVGTLDLSLLRDGKNKFMWTRATDVTLSRGNWRAHSFVFSNGHHLTVTSPHLMIIWKNGISYFVRADNVQVFDKMIVDEIETHITEIRNRIITTKVAIETEDGTVQANRVLASGICEDNPELLSNIVQYDSVIKSYKSSHFGEEYYDMCMDNVAWKNAYRINNQLQD